MLTLTKKLTVCGVLAVLVLTGAPEVCGQIVYGQPAAGSGQVIYYHWQAKTDGGEETVSQLMFPITGFFPVRDNFDISLYVANSSNTAEDPTGEYKLSGLGDVLLQANHSFMNDQLLFSVGLNLPTGKKELNGEQQQVLMAMAQNYFELPMSRFGEGLGLSLLVGGALELKPGMRAGAGVSYRYVGSYTPYEDFIIFDTVTDSINYVSYEDYNPGDLISANAGVDLQKGAMLWSLDVIFSQYSPDQLDGTRLFRQSRMFDSRLKGQYVGEGIMASATVRYVWRGNNRIYDELGEWEATRKLYGNELRLSGDVSYSVATNWVITPTVDLRLISGTQVTDAVSVESSNIFGFGSSIGRSLGENLGAQVGFKYYTGTIYGGEADLSGYRVTFGLTASM